MSQKQETFQAQGKMQAYTAAPVPDKQKTAKPGLPRSISTTNLETTNRCRSVIQNDWRANAPVGGTNYFATTPGYTLILPALNDYPGDFQKFVFSRIVAKGMQESMEKEYCLNWCPNATKLVPLNTIGDGNCLLHAASLAMWGFQDRDCVLRRALSHAVNDGIRNNTLHQRWKHNREMENQQQFGLHLEAHQWDQEWQMVKQQTSATALAGQNLESLDEFHVFILANVLRRPIIMYAVPKLRSHQTDGTLQKINFHGVYLPLLWAPDSCKKNPLPLAYHNNHFSALVVVESAQQYQDGQLLLPLSDYYSQQLPVRFTLPVEDPNTMVMDYLSLVQAPAGSPYFSNSSVICARMTISNEPTYLKPLISGFIDACYEAYTAERQQNQFNPNVQPSTIGGQERPLCINDCGMYGDPTTGLCSKCRQKAFGAAQAQEKAAFEEKLPQQPQGQFQHHVNEQPRLPDPAIGGVSGAIKCPRCSNPGHPSYLGMCEQCFKSKSTKQVAPATSNERERWSQTQGVSQQGKDPVYEVLPTLQSTSQENKPMNAQHPPALPPPRNTGGGPLERSQCRTPGCEFFGTRETRFYCSKCFETDMKRILEEVDQSNVPGLPSDRRLSDGMKAPPTFSPGIPGSSREPPKCYKCREFFASDEYNGMCHGCFMKMTADIQGSNQETQWGKAQTEPKYNLQTVQAERRCGSLHCHNPATENGYCEYCNAAGAVGTTPVTYQQSRTQVLPVPKPRSKFSTQPVTPPVDNLSSSLAGMSVSANESVKCFLCSGGNIGASNFVCERHARLMQDLQKASPNQYGVSSHTQPTHDVRTITPQKSAIAYEEPRVLKPSEPFQPKVGSSVVGNIPFGVPIPSMAPPILSASHGGAFANASAYPATQDNYFPGNSQLEAAQSYRQNHYGAGSTANPDAFSAGASGGAAGGETIAAGVNPPAKTLCARAGCSFKGYKELYDLCPDCYKERYDKSAPPEFPLV